LPTSEAKKMSSCEKFDSVIFINVFKNQVIMQIILITSYSLNISYSADAI